MNAVQVALGKFAKAGIEAHLGTDLAVAVQAAAAHYRRRLKSKWPPVGMPRFCRDHAPQSAQFALDLAVPAETRAALEGEARAQRTDLDKILTHAVFVYLADLDFAGGELTGPHASPARNDGLG